MQQQPNKNNTDNMMKSQTNTFSKYYNDNKRKKYDI